MTPAAPAASAAPAAEELPATGGGPSRPTMLLALIALPLLAVAIRRVARRT